MEEELIKGLLMIFSKYPETTIIFTEGRFIIEGLHKDRVILELQYVVDVMANHDQLTIYQ